MKSTELLEKPNFKSGADLRVKWREERAFRSGNALTRVGFGLSLLTVLLNLKYNGLAEEVAADMFLVVGCGLSMFLTKLQAPRRHFVWWPFYFGIYLATLPSTWWSGGLYSPWLGFYLALIAIIGCVVQTRIQPIYNLVFTVLNLAMWAFIGKYYPYPFAKEYLASRPTSFMIFAALITVFAIGYCLLSLLKTEADLADEIARQYEELFETRATLSREESANQAKSNFLANISHELRTPLGAILGYAGLLQNEQTPVEDKLMFAKTIERNGEQLARLVDDLLDLAKIEAGRVEIEKIDTKTMDMVTETVDLFELNAKKKGIQLTIHFATAIPEIICTDPFRFKQIFMNVLGNALKFTASGSIRTTVRFSFSPTPVLTIIVKDTGRGIALEERSKLFKRFSQADASMTRRYGGTGLGLNFSRELAKLLGGDLELTWSELNMGSEFTFRIPVEVPEKNKMIDQFCQIPQPEKTLGNGNFNFKDAKILVVDDSPDNRDLIHRYLSSSGAVIDEAEDGYECLEKVSCHPYDMILMDIQMPRMDGLKATSELRLKHYDGPIIAITAHAMTHDRIRCIEAGCDSHVAKPIQRAELMKRIDQCMMQKHTGPYATLSMN